jgi:membrane fusion protein, multidrug efflux system
MSTIVKTTISQLKTRLIAFVSGIFGWMRRHWKLSLLILVITIGGSIYWHRQRQANQVELTFQKPIMEKLVKTLELSGVVDANEKARLRFLAGGKITYLGAQEGDMVKKWQTIAAIDQATLKKQLEQDLNLFMQERLDWDQLNDDVFFNEYTTTEERDVEKGQLDLTNEVLDVEIRDIAISNTRLSAPFAGIITKSPTSVAGVQLISTDYFELVNPESMIFRAEVDEADISLIKMGQRGQIILDAYLDKEITGNVEYISFATSETANGTVFVIEIPLNSLMYGSNFFRLGMNGNIDIELETRENTMSIPLIAIKEVDDQVYVDIKTNDNEFVEREITIGLETDENVEVLSGLSLEDEVLIPE